LGNTIEAFSFADFNESQVHIDLNNIESGVYLFKVQIANELHIERIVIAKN